MDGRASWNELTGLCTRHAIRRALDRGEIRSVGRGLYALPELPVPREAAATVGGVLSHLSAAAQLGLAVLVRPDAVHVTVARATHRAPVTGVAVHRSDLEVADASRIATRPLRTVLDCAATLPFAEALAVADSALRQGFVRREDLIYAAELRRGPGRRTVVRVAHAADGDAANPFESALRATVLDAGLSGFVPQQAVTIKSVTGRPMTVHVDLGDRVRRVALEADSYEHHGGRAALRDDCRRYDELVRAGWLVLRFAWEHVLFDTAWVTGVVGDTCASRAAQNTAAGNGVA